MQFVFERILVMHIFSGKGVYQGIAIGEIVFFDKKKERVKRIKIDDIKKEEERLKNACETAKKQLEKLYIDAKNKVGHTNAEIFNIHKMMIDDTDFLESIINIIKNEKANAEYAVAVTGDNFSKMFSAMDDEYMRERANDVRDISAKIIAVLSKSEDDYQIKEPSVIFADDLLPSQTLRFDKNKVLAFVTSKGSINSHTAILARSMNIPAVVGVGDIFFDVDGEEVIVDGFEGKVYVKPDAETKEKLSKKKKLDEDKKLLLQDLKGEESITLDGKKINIFANIGGLSDVADVLFNDADGIGLFRSEFLYLNSSDYPSEEKQFSVYKTVLQNMAGKKVIIRTLDIGADKNIEYFNIDKEENPALGYRAIRICLDRVHIFKSQLRALLRASAYGNISIMLPMIVSVDEVKKVKEILFDIKNELDRDKIPFNQNIELGIMIETPAAVMMSDCLAKEVDFFSIGTNDLTQYTLAADRQNPKVEYLLEKPDVSVLRMIKMVCDNAKKENIWVGVCGELASDLRLCEYFLKVGVTELSVSASSVLLLRKKIINTDISKINLENLNI